MRASDADRERVAGVLREAYAEGRLTRVEHEERLSAVYEALTYGDLVPVLRDLPVPAHALDFPHSFGLDKSESPPQQVLLDPVHAGTPAEDAIAIFSGFERSGAWTVPPEFSAVCVFGGGELDLTEAVLASHETVITAVCVFGGLEITVPDAMVVRSEVIGIFGGTEIPRDVTPPAGPVLVVKGVAIFGGVEVRRTRRGRIPGG